MLSGGEKSTTTLQLLASIARHCNLPFRAHDEPDVFQDENNRAATLRTVILDATAERNGTGRAPQFLFLTPLDISSVVDFKARPELRSLVKVWRLPEPNGSESAGAGAGAAGSSESAGASSSSGTAGAGAGAGAGSKGRGRGTGAAASR